MASKKKADGKSRTPSPEHEQRLWQRIENAWASLGPDVNRARAALAQRDPDDEPDDQAVQGALDAFIAKLKRNASALSSEELTDLDRALERKLYDIDRVEIQEVTDGSDDGFLYCRGYIVALGKAFYDAVNQTPSVALLGAECEDLCYLFAHLHEKRFGSWPDTGSNISRESTSNEAGWEDG